MAHNTLPRWKQTFTACTAAQTTRLAETLRDGFSAGDTLLLDGPIGAGKSHFARSLIRAKLADVDLVEDIPSPTFTLVQTYQAGELEIWHSDLYRLSMLDEVYELGLFDAFETALCLVEWPDRLGEARPENALTVRFSIAQNPDFRDITLSASDPKWDWLRDRLNKVNWRD